MYIKNSISTFENSHIRFAVTDPTHNRSSFCQKNHRNLLQNFIADVSAFLRLLHGSRRRKNLHFNLSRNLRKTYL